MLPALTLFKRSFARFPLAQAVLRSHARESLPTLRCP